MRKSIVFPLLALAAVSLAQAPITSNPLPEPIVKKGLAAEVKDVVRLPDTRETRSADQDVSAGNYARVSYVKDWNDRRTARLFRIRCRQKQHQ